MKENWKVYCHQNKLNGKKYIGITSKPTLDARCGKNGERYGYHFGHAIKKYGWDNFDHYILFENLTRAEACMFEQYFIEEFNTQNPSYGYNITAGGEGRRFQHSAETRKKISEVQIGREPWNKGKKTKPLTVEQREKLSKALIGKNKGKHLTDEQKHKISEALHKRIVSDKTRQKMSESRKGKLKGRVFINNGIENKLVTKDELEKYFELGWIKGIKRSAA